MLGRKASIGIAVLCLFAHLPKVFAQAPPDSNKPAAESEHEPSPASLTQETPPILAAQSEEDLFRLDSQVAKSAISIASKRDELADEAPGSITIITSEQIRDMNAMSLSDVLNALVPGMDVVPTYFRYGDHNTGVYSRGLLSDFSQQVLFLLNGQTKFNESTYASPYMAIQFNLENIERVEVSRTPIPLQGGGAITVINLVTKDQYLRNGGQAYLDFGTNQNDFTSSILQSVRATVILNHDLGDFRVYGSAQYYTDHGQVHSEPNGRGDYMQDPNLLRDGVHTFTNFTLGIQSKDDRFAFHSWFQYVLEDPFFAGQIPTPSIDPYKYDGLQWLTQLRWRPWRQLRLLAGSMVGSSTSITDYQNTPFLSSVSNYDVYVEGYYDIRFTAGGQHSLLIGGRYEREGQYKNLTATYSTDHFEADPEQPNYSRTVLSMYIDESIRAFNNRLIVAAGARMDMYVGYGDTFERAPSGRVSMQIRPRREISISLNYATVARPPSSYERIGTGDPSIIGSPDVSSERVQTVEAALTARIFGLRAQVIPFFQAFSDKIEYVPLPGDVVFQARNNGSTRVLGVDLDLRYNFTPRSYAFVNGSYVNSHDLQSDQQTYFLPSIYLNFGGNYAYRGLNLNAYGYFRDKRPLPVELVINNQNTTINFTLNASIAYTFAKGLRAYILCENLSGIRNNIPLSTDGLLIPTRGRTFHIGLQYGRSADQSN